MTSPTTDLQDDVIIEDDVIIDEEVPREVAVEPDCAEIPQHEIPDDVINNNEAGEANDVTIPTKPTENDVTNEIPQQIPVEVVHSNGGDESKENNDVTGYDANSVATETTNEREIPLEPPTYDDVISEIDAPLNKSLDRMTSLQRGMTSHMMSRSASVSSIPIPVQHYDVITTTKSTRGRCKQNSRLSLQSEYSIVTSSNDQLIQELRQKRQGIERDLR